MENPFILSDEKLKILLDSYFLWLKKEEKEKSYIEKQTKRAEDLRLTLLRKEYLSSCSKEELFKTVWEYTRSLERPVKIPLGEPRIKNALEDVKRNLIFFIENEEDLFRKAEKIIKGDYKIPFFAEAFWTPLFQAFQPNVLPNWNNKTVQFFLKVGINLRDRKRPFEERYRTLSELFRYLVSLDPRHDFYTVNHLMHYAISVEEGRKLLEELVGMPPVPPVISYWRVIEPLDTKDITAWPVCKKEGLIAIGYSDKPDNINVKRFKEKIKIGDKVLAYLEKGRIGGIGTVIGDYEDYSEIKPKDKDYFNGKFWRFRKVTWDYLPEREEYWQLPKEQIPGRRMTIYEFKKGEFEKIMKYLQFPEQPKPNGSDKFEGFSKEAFLLLKILDKDTSYEAVKKIEGDIRSKVMFPLKNLFSEISREFDPRNMLNLEKEKRIISSLFKMNPRLGAWPFIWGAFYQKGKRRPISMQFFIWMNKDSFCYGVYPSRNEPLVKNMLIKNFERYGEQLKEYLPDNFLEYFSFYEDYKPGKEREFFKIKDISSLIKCFRERDVNVGKVLSPADVIESKSKLVTLIREDFEKLVPIYIFGTSEDPVSVLQLDYEVPEPQVIITKQEVLKEIFLDESQFDQIISLLEGGNKKQVILQGPPGTGKTFISKRVAEYITQSKERVSTIQFHASYSYEDFVEGYRPKKEGGFDLRDGIFKDICKEAKADKSSSKYALLIDEINRGNISKIFGELLYLLEYRDQEVQLAYSQEYFSIPDNLYIIGTMNTADRSLAIMDYALRRRFFFVTLQCQTKRLAEWLRNHGCRLNTEDLTSMINDMNKAIQQEMPNADFSIGHSYFMKENMDAAVLRRALDYEIKPLLEEYFFDKRDRVDEILKIIKIDAQ